MIINNESKNHCGSLMRVVQWYNLKKNTRGLVILRFYLAFIYFLFCLQILKLKMQSNLIYNCSFIK